MILKLCKKHWNLLKTEIDFYGLSHLVSRSDELDTEVIEKALEGTYETDDFDPLLMATFYLWHVALGLYAEELMASLDDDGALYCPVCLHESHDGDAAEWIDMATSMALTEARKLGFAPPLQ